MNKEFKLFNISFINGSYKETFSRLVDGCFMVVPSGPGLSTIDKDKRYWDALKNSDFALPDSSFMLLLCRLFLKKRIKKLSGAKFIRFFFNEPLLRKENYLFCIDPSFKESNINRNYLNNIGIPLKAENQYIAPLYDKNNVIDLNLMKLLESLEYPPKFILINIGGGIQERLGSYIKNNLSFSSGIICTGAAISFLTGSQAKIPKWVDRIYLGWLARIFQDPKVFFIRYLKAFRLIYIFYLNKKGKLI